MIWRTAQRFDLDGVHSFMIGPGGWCMTIFDDLGYVDEHPGRPDFIASSLSEAAEIVVSHT
jgi:hypothetical protein